MQRSVIQLFTIFRKLVKKNQNGYPIVDKYEHLCYSAYVVWGGVWSRAWVVAERNNADQRKWSLPKRTCLCPRVSRPVSLAFLRRGLIGGLGESGREQETYN